MNSKVIVILLSALMALACTQKSNQAEVPSMAGVCEYVTSGEIERALGTTLTETPEEIKEEYLGGKGCSYAGKPESNEAHFAYIIFTSATEFDKAKSGQPTSGVGDEAYTVSGPDAQQLWVRQGDQYVLVAIGDVPRPEDSKYLAELILERLKRHPLVK